MWGGLSSAALYLGQAVAGPLEQRRRLTGQVMGFGAGALLSAVAYELIPESTLSKSAWVGLAFLVGALAYYVGDRIVDDRGGDKRQALGEKAEEGSGMAMFLGALLDGIPEAFVLGIGLAVGGEISVAFVAAIFVSNIPQGAAGTISMQQAGVADRRIFWMWTGLTVACAIAAGLGFVLSDSLPDGGLYAQAFAAGAVLTMLADSMMPEAFEHGGRTVGLITVLGFLAAGVLSVAG